VDVGFVIVGDRQAFREVNVTGPRKAFLHRFKKRVVIERRIAVFCGQEVVFVRNYGQIGLDIRAREIVVVHERKPFLRVLKRLFVQRVFELCNKPIREIHAVIVLLPENAERHETFQRPELLTKRKLVERIAFKILRPFAVCKTGKRKRGELRQISPLRLRLCIRGLYPRENREAEQEGGEE